MQPVQRFAVLRDLILYVVYRMSFAPGTTGVFSEDEILKRVPAVAPDALIQKAFASLLSEGNLEINQDDIEPRYGLSTNGFLRLDDRLDDDDSGIAFVAREYGEAVDERALEVQRLSKLTVIPAASETPVFAPREVPASDRVVHLDHNSTTFKEAVASLDSALREFEEDHRPNIFSTNEKSALTQVLEAGRKLLDDSTLDLRLGTLMLIEPIQEVISRYKEKAVESAIKVLFETALKAVLKLFGIGG